MKHSSTLYLGLDVHKESIAVAYVSDTGLASIGAVIVILRSFSSALYRRCSKLERYRLGRYSESHGNGADGDLANGCASVAAFVHSLLR